MATPSLSAIFSFVKKYPITLCGFSLFFMPSVHRLLLYFTPLLLSTAIFIVAMMSWGPNTSAEKSKTRRSKPKLVSEHHEWAFNESMGIEEEEEDDEEEDEEEKEEVEEDDDEQGNTKASHKSKGSMDLHTQEITHVAEVGSDVGLSPRRELEPDPDLGKEECSDGGTDVNCQAEPDLKEEDHAVGNPPRDAVCQAAPDAVGNPAIDADQLDPELQGDGEGTAALDAVVGHDVVLPRVDHGMGDAQASHGKIHEHGDGDGVGGEDDTHDPHKHKRSQKVVPTERPPHYLKVCA